MKKLAISLILGASLIVTPSAFALKAMTADNMKSTTGQAGVSIAIDDVTIYQSVGTTTYTDNDGYGTAAVGGGISVSGDEQLTTIRAILNAQGNRGGFLANDYDAMMAGTGAYAGTRTGTAIPGAAAIGAIAAAPLTIDVTGKVAALSYGLAFNHRNDALTAYTAVTTTFGITDFTNDAANVATIAANLDGDATDATTQAEIDSATATYGLADLMASQATQDSTTSFGVMQQAINVAGVVIGLPTIEVRKTGTMKKISVAASGSNNDGDLYIMTKKSDSTLAVLGGYIEICPH